MGSKIGRKNWSKMVPSSSPRDQIVSASVTIYSFLVKTLSKDSVDEITNAFFETYISIIYNLRRT